MCWNEVLWAAWGGVLRRSVAPEDNDTGDAMDAIRSSGCCWAANMAQGEALPKKLSSLTGIPEFAFWQHFAENLWPMALDMLGVANAAAQAQTRSRGYLPPDPAIETYREEPALQTSVLGLVLWPEVIIQSWPVEQIKAARDLLYTPTALTGDARDMQEILKDLRDVLDDGERDVTTLLQRRCAVLDREILERGTATSTKKDGHQGSDKSAISGSCTLLRRVRML